MMKFEDIETVLQIKLPSSYINFHQLEIEEHFKSIYLSTDENWLIETNKMMDLPKESGMMNGKFCIGEDGCGSYYLINLDERDTIVYSTEHDVYEWEEIFDSEKDDFKWNHKGLQTAGNLKDFLNYFLNL